MTDGFKVCSTGSQPQFSIPLMQLINLWRFIYWNIPYIISYQYYSTCLNIDWIDVNNHADYLIDNPVKICSHLNPYTDCSYHNRTMTCIWLQSIHQRQSQCYSYFIRSFLWRQSSVQLLIIIMNRQGPQIPLGHDNVTWTTIQWKQKSTEICFINDTLISAMS